MRFVKFKLNDNFFHNAIKSNSNLTGYNIQKSLKRGKMQSSQVQKPKAASKKSRAKKSEVEELKQLFLQHFNKPKTELVFTNEFELLVAVMLSAQCTDKRVNLITPRLFEAYPTAEALSKAKLTHLKELISSCSFFNNKAENLQKMAQSVCENFGGQIPLDQQALQSLAGVGQKTANVVLIEWCGANLMAVDTHVFRVSHRLGLSFAKTPKECEAELTRLFKDRLNELHQAFVLFGRYTCKAVRPKCEECFARRFCKAEFEAKKGLV